MALNFPDAPTANQVFTVGNASWIWDTVKWVASTMASPLPVVNGGTGANTSSGALSNLGAMPKVGVTDGSNAAAGQIGEWLQAGNSYSNLSWGIWLTPTQITLSPGDWDVWGYVSASPGAASTLTNVNGSFSNVVNAQGTVLFEWLGSISTGSIIGGMIPQRYNVTTSTIVYLTTYLNGTGTNNSLAASIYARRVR
jgi:hypothetical protein